MDGFSRLHEHIGTVMENHPESHQYMHEAYDMSQQYLHLTHADNRMQYQSSHVVDADTVVPEYQNMNRVQRMPRRQGRGGGQRRAHHDEAGTSNQGRQAPSHLGEASSSGFNVEAAMQHGEASGSNTQIGHNIFNFEPSGSNTQFQYMTPPPNLTFGSQDSTQFGNMFENCYQPAYDNNVNRNNSPISFDIDMNVPWDQYETQVSQNETQEVVEEGRPRRNRRAPDCGTGGRRGHLH